VDSGVAVFEKYEKIMKEIFGLLKRTIKGSIKKSSQKRVTVFGTIGMI
jgi:hypothetical protein